MEYRIVEYLGKYTVEEKVELWKPFGLFFGRKKKFDWVKLSSNGVPCVFIGWIPPMPPAVFNNYDSAVDFVKSLAKGKVIHRVAL